MRRTLRTSLTVLAINVLIVGTASAQSADIDDYAVTTLFFNKGVQEDLKLNENQTEQARRLAAHFNAEMLGAFQSTYKKVSGQKRREAMRDLMKPLNEEANKTITAILRIEQQMRYRQIVLQRKGIQAFANREIQDELNLNDAQKQKLQAITEESNEKTKEILQTVREIGPQAALEKFETLRKEVMEKAVAELTGAQKKSWREKIGEPFDYKFEPLR